MLHVIDPDLHLVVHRRRVVADGPLRPRLARPRGLPRAWAPTPTVLLWNFFGIDAVARRRRSPWCSPRLLALVVAYPCSRFQVVGHYFGLVTLAVGEVIRLLIVAERDWTGGSLGVSASSPRARRPASGRSSSRTSASSTTSRIGRLAGRALGVGARGPQHGPRGHGGHRRGRDGGGLGGHPRHPVQDRRSPCSPRRSPRWAGCCYAQYVAYANPDTLSGIGVSLRIVFAVVLGGMYSLLGPIGGHRADHRAVGVPAHLLRASSSSAWPRRSTGSLLDPLHHLPALGHLRQPARRAAWRRQRPRPPGQRRRRSGISEARMGEFGDAIPSEEPPKAVLALAEQVERDGGHALAVYREPVGDHWQIFCLLPADEGRAHPVPARSLAHPRQAARRRW